jgi:hypothetical protein
MYRVEPLTAQERLGYDSNDNGANKDSNDRDSHGIYWLADLLPNDIPNARILAWSYDSNYCDDTTSAMLKNGAFKAAGPGDILLCVLQGLELGDGENGVRGA